jgi:hypothetical protein
MDKKENFNKNFGLSSFIFQSEQAKYENFENSRNFLSVLEDQKEKSIPDGR